MQFKYNQLIDLFVYLFVCQMCERKSWTKMEDKVLKLLHQQRGFKKWSDVAQIMRTQYGIQGRNGKQCRERYHNHLDERISKSQWTAQQDQTLLRLHNQIGNRWALIARQIKGRTDNCVKNRFYSRFRRSIRNINGLIKVFWKKQFKQLKQTFISKIIQITEQYRLNKQNGNIELFNICEGNQVLILDLKCRLMNFSQVTEADLRQNLQMLNSLYQLIRQTNSFNRKNKRRGKKKRRSCSDFQDDQDLWSQDRYKPKSLRQKMRQNKSQTSQQSSNFQPIDTQYIIKKEQQSVVKTKFRKICNKIAKIKHQQAENKNNNYKNDKEQKQKINAGLKNQQETVQELVQLNDQIIQKTQRQDEYYRSIIQIKDNNQLCLYQNFEENQNIFIKKDDIFQYPNQKKQEGFDINQFYSIDDFELNHQKYFY